MVEGIRQAGGKPIYFEYFGLGHNSWDAAYAEPELLDWIFAQRLGQPDTYALKTPKPELPAVARLPETDDGIPGTGPIRRYDWFRSLWKQKRLGWSKNVAKDQGAIVFLGDSITQGWNSLAKDFPNRKVANRGISGDTSRGVLYRLKEDVTDLNPKAVVLLIGTNDIEEKATPAMVAGNVRLILEALQRHNAKMPVVVCKVMPSATSMRRPSATLQEVNALVDRVLPDFPQAIRCDTWTPFASETGDAKKDEFPDLLHPNAAGYARFANTLRPILDRL
jgi:lysophospholipase L1-like esterase